MTRMTKRESGQKPISPPFSSDKEAPQSFREFLISKIGKKLKPYRKHQGEDYFGVCVLMEVIGDYVKLKAIKMDEEGELFYYVPIDEIAYVSNR